MGLRSEACRLLTGPLLFCDTDRNPLTSVENERKTRVPGNKVTKINEACELLRLSLSF